MPADERLSDRTEIEHSIAVNVQQIERGHVEDKAATPPSVVWPPRSEHSVSSLTHPAHRRLPEVILRGLQLRRF